jgi:predicted NAD/FAD-dependent oxidoreductase
MDVTRVAVIGAGVAGLACAQALAAQGVAVTVFDKSRGPGGRCATRRSEAGAFDHGCDGFAAAHDGFVAELERAVAAGLLRADDGTPGRWRGTQGLNAWSRAAAQGLDLRLNVAIAAIEPDALADGPAPRSWLRAAEGTAWTDADAGPWDTVIVAVPAEQAVPLLAPAPDLQAALRDVRSLPTWTVMAAWPESLPLPPSVEAAADPADPGPLARARLQTHGRDAAAQAGIAERRVVHATAYWSAHNLDARPADVTERLLGALGAHAGVRLARPSWSTAHRWKFAQVETPLADECGWDPQRGLGSCGDAWAGAPGREGVERAWLSGRAMAARVLSAGLR